MRLLAVDTATEICGVALMTQGRTDAQVVYDHGETHTRHVMRAIDSVLESARAPLSSVDAFVVTRGPGSFTGLRIGISTVKGLAMAMDKPLVGVSSLAVLANQADAQFQRICPMIDARRNELYWGLYQRSHEGVMALSPETVGPADQIAAHLDAPCLFIGNGVPLYRDIIEDKLDVTAHWALPEQGRLQPAVLARLGWQKLQQGPPDDVLTFGPVYLRASDAEKNRAKVSRDPKHR